MAYVSDPRVLSLHALRLRGLCEAEGVAELYGIDTEVVRGLLADAHDRKVVERRDGRISGFRLTDVGRAEGERLLAAEVQAADAAAALDDCYRRFRSLNDRFVKVCTDWQLRRVDGVQDYNDHTDPTYDQDVLDRLFAIDDELQPLLVSLADALARFSIYTERFAVARDRIGAGELDYVTKPMFPSYHTVWFELHEDLLATLGIDRASESGSA